MAYALALALSAGAVCAGTNVLPAVEDMSVDTVDLVNLITGAVGLGTPALSALGDERKGRIARKLSN